MSEDKKLEKPFVLRVRQESDLGRVLRELQRRGKMTKEEIMEFAAKKGTYYEVRRIGRDFDNIDVEVPWGGEEHTLHYTDVNPGKVQVVSGETTVEGNGQVPTSRELKMQWPAAPPIIEEMDNFDEPSWFPMMEKMVEIGKHIALEGPPSVGKDTAVEQLAARHRKPLVAVGGDKGFRRRDLTGSYADLGLFEVAEYVTAAINGWWVLITEVNAADPDALMYINTQLAPPNVVTLNGQAYPVHEDFRIFVSYNHGLIGTKPLPQSFKDRFFSIKVPFFTEYRLGKRLEAMGMPLEQSWTDLVTRFGMAMWDAHERGQMRYQITTRRLIDAVDLKMNITGMEVEEALKMAVIAAIDSPIEAKTAEQVLSSTVEQFRSEYQV